MNDVSFRIMLIAKLMWGLQASINDDETAFLDGKLSEYIYMNASNGMEIESNKCLRIKNYLRISSERKEVLFEIILWTKGPCLFEKRIRPLLVK